MIYDLQTIRKKYSGYSNLPQKISSETKKNNLFRVKRGLYTDNPLVDLPVIANVCYGPSYISFEYALSYYGLIPEHVSVYTSACYGKKNNKSYSVSETVLEYRSIPDEVFPYGIEFKENEEGMHYKIAVPEKALCDTLYSKYPVRSVKDLKILMFEDLRIDEDEFLKLDMEFMIQISSLYHSNTLLTLSKYLKKIKEDVHSFRKNDSDV